MSITTENYTEIPFQKLTIYSAVEAMGNCTHILWVEMLNSTTPQGEFGIT
jgi:hypothetical protein